MHHLPRHTQLIRLSFICAFLIPAKAEAECGLIRNSELRAHCRAQLEGRPTACRTIGDYYWKAYCRALSSRTRALHSSRRATFQEIP